MSATGVDVTNIGDAILDAEALSEHLEKHVQHCRDTLLAKEVAENRCELMEHKRQVVLAMAKLEARDLGEKVVATQDAIARTSPRYLAFLDELDVAMLARADARAENAAAIDAKFAAKVMIEVMLNNCATIRAATQRLAPLGGISHDIVPSR